MSNDDTPHALPVDEGIRDQCLTKFSALVQAAGSERLDAVLRELYLDSFLFYDAGGNLRVDLTDLQLVAITYGLGAFLKGGGDWDGERVWGGRYYDTAPHQPSEAF